MFVNFGFNGKRAFGGAWKFLQPDLGALYKWPIKGKADQSFAPGAVSQLKVSTPGGGFVVLLLSPPSTPGFKAN